MNTTKYKNETPLFSHRKRKPQFTKFGDLQPIFRCRDQALPAYERLDVSSPASWHRAWVLKYEHTSCLSAVKAKVNVIYSSTSLSVSCCERITVKTRILCSTGCSNSNPAASRGYVIMYFQTPQVIEFSSQR